MSMDVSWQDLPRDIMHHILKFDENQGGSVTVALVSYP